MSKTDAELRDELSLTMTGYHYGVLGSKFNGISTRNKVDSVYLFIKQYGDQRELNGRESELAGFDNLSWRDNRDIMWSHIKSRRAELTTLKNKQSKEDLIV